jgi:hypothetical protein
MPINTDIAYKKERIVRVIVTRPGPGNLYTVGTAFPAGMARRYMTCFHVIFGKSLKELRADQTFQASAGANEHEKLATYQQANTANIQLQLSNGSLINAVLESFSEQYDSVLLSTTGGPEHFFELEIEHRPNIGDQIFFCGYQYAVGIEAKNFPFTVNSGFVSTIVPNEVAGGNYEHLQLNSINLGGNSGAPVFRRDSNVVVAMINGNMNWGRDDIAVVNGPGLVKKDSLRVPLSIAYATPLSLLYRETNLLG